MDERDIIDMLGKVWKQVGNPFARLPILIEFPTGFDDTATGFFATSAEGFHLDGFAIHTVHCGLVIEGVHMAWPAIHVKENNAGGLGGAMRFFRSERVKGLCSLCFEERIFKHACECNASKASACLPNEFASGIATEVFHGSPIKFVVGLVEEDKFIEAESNKAEPAESVFLAERIFVHGIFDKGSASVDFILFGLSLQSSTKDIMNFI